MSNAYWVQRERDALYEKQLGIAEAQLAKEYQQCAKTVQNKLESLYDEIIASRADGTILVSDLYKYNRYYDLMNELNIRLVALGEKEIKTTNQVLTDMYKDNGAILGKELHRVLPIDENAMKNALDCIWCKDGKHWSDRVWSNKALLQEKIKEGLIDDIARGASKDELVKDLMNTMGTGFYEADRIARTELNFIQNKSTYDKYVEAGITEYKFLAELDDRTSEVCEEHNGKVYRLSDAVVGENYPPLHPNCRSTVLAVIK